MNVVQTLGTVTMTDTASAPEERVSGEAVFNKGHALTPGPRACSAGIALVLRLLGGILLLASLLAVDTLPGHLWPLLLLPAGVGTWLALVSLYLRGYRLSDVMDLGPQQWYP